ncbi:hypothetical protein [Chitinophaga barathri]|uniref:DUF1772 domain-containing protein n=1 Tax=Chitinophaga barathri TaxID=1647451 RepID=A0A3N4M7S2_9BACT|nr:hypothetical protein [Chitinophaga barathri]RPD39522.1 hypothetical protein EG028_20625 [Chitinophaga barathri]
MKKETFRTVILFLFIGLVFYCYGTRMMDYFTIYKTWELVGEREFAAFHQEQSTWIISVFVIPAAVMTLLNILAFIFPASYVSRKLIGFALIVYAFDWISSFTTQIPIQFKLHEGKNMQLLDDLLRTNWWRFSADTIQFALVCVLLWQLLRRLERSSI